MLNELLNNKDRRFILVGGKGGTGKTTMSAALAVKFASEGQTTLIISTDPAHSLSDSLDQKVGGGQPIKVDGVDNLWAMEVNPEDSTEDFKHLAGIEDDEEAVDDLRHSLDAFGMDEISELMETVPPGFDEAVALAKTVQFIKKDEYAHYDRIIFDTAPTGHTLRLLTLPDFLDSFVGKLMKIRVKMNNAKAAFQSMLGVEAEKDHTIEIMEALKESMGEVRELFRDDKQTEFIISTIPTIMSINESERLKNELQMDNISVQHLIVNQIMPENIDCQFCSVRSKGQDENLEYIENVFHDLDITKIPFFDHEVRGTSELKKMGNYLLGQKQLEQ